MALVDGTLLGVNPLQIPQVYETLVAGGELSPGVCELSGFSRSWDWDKKKAKGNSGASTTLQGEALASGTIKFKIWRPEHFLEWTEFRDVLVRGLKQKKIEAIDVLHPILQELEIFSLVVEEIGQLVHEGRGLYSYTVKFTEFRQPKPAGGSPSGSKSSSGVGEPSGIQGWLDAQGQQDKELEDLIAEAKAA